MTSRDLIQLGSSSSSSCSLDLGTNEGRGVKNSFLKGLNSSIVPGEEDIEKKKTKFNDVTDEDVEEKEKEEEVSSSSSGKAGVELLHRKKNKKIFIDTGKIKFQNRSFHLSSYVRI